LCGAEYVSVYMTRFSAHEKAALKERQMETLKSALGIDEPSDTCL
ncbi:hypothetical protein MIMGU_mgv1a0233652mg, partial [Erythranthe guttata]